MRRNHLIVLIALMFMSICVHAQQVSFSGTQIPLEHFFSEVSRQTGFVFFYNASLLGNASLISIHIENMPLDSALRIALKNQPYSFDIRGKTIFISSNENIPSSSFKTEKNPDLFVTKGLVIDQSGNPMAGASVFNEKTKVSSISGENGVFLINTRKGDSLTISFIGFRKQVIVADNQMIRIILEYETNPLEQVVVGGNYFATKKKSDISSITVIDSLTLQNLPFQDVSEIYRGLVTGTNSYSSGDEIQNFPTLSIRGAGSETAISQIDVYVDG